MIGEYVFEREYECNLMNLHKGQDKVGARSYNLPIQVSRGLLMKKTYITTMPNHIGAFLKASECLASLGINITRVSYNKAVDSHTLFIDAEGEEEQLRKADEELRKIGYLRKINISLITRSRV